MRTTLTVGLLSLLIFAGCQQKDNIHPVKDGHADDAAVAVNGFAVDLYRELATDEGNLFFSPASISTALIMVWAGANGATAEETGGVLHLGSDRNQVLADHSQLLKELTAPDNSYTLNVANRIWGQKDFSFRSQFLNEIQQYFGGGFQAADFQKNSEKERIIINQWVADQTADKIQDLLPEGSIDHNTRLVLTNAVYFLGDWVFPFHPRRTRDEDFHTADGVSVKVPTMKLTKNLPYYSDDDLAMVALPYQKRDLDFLVLLPHRNQGLSALESTLTNAGLTGKIQSMESRNIDVWLPKMELAQSFNLNQKLQQLSMKMAFDPGNADFSGMTGQPGLFISSVVHKSFLKVDEKGTEAAAATGVAIALTGVDAPPTRFVADHPFLFLIRHKNTGAILFMGRLESPNI